MFMNLYLGQFGLYNLFFISEVSAKQSSILLTLAKTTAREKQSGERKKYKLKVICFGVVRGFSIFFSARWFLIRGAQFCKFINFWLFKFLEWQL